MYRTLRTVTTTTTDLLIITEIGKKALLFARLQPGGARKRINAP